MFRLRLYSVSNILLGFGWERACLGRYFEVCRGFAVAQGDMTIEQVTMEICWHVFGGILGAFPRIYVLPAVKSRRTNLASKRSQVGMGFLMAQEVFPSFVRAVALRVVALEHYGNMTLQAARRSRSQAHCEGLILNLVNNTNYTA